MSLRPWVISADEGPGATAMADAAYERYLRGLTTVKLRQLFSYQRAKAGRYGLWPWGSIFAILSSVIFPNIAFSEEPLSADKKPAPAYVGSFFDTQVSLENYYFIKGVLAIFGNKFGPQPSTPQEQEDIVWEQLLLSYEAFRRGITVSDEELNAEMGKILSGEKVAFDWKKDKDAYEKWVSEKTNEPATAFEGQLKHLIQLQKLRQKIMESVEPPVSEEEAYQEFLNENNNLGVELLQFDLLKDAQTFYEKARRGPKFWEEEKKKRPNDFKRPGVVSLEFLMDLWGFEQAASYRMMRMKIGQLHPPAPIYKGYGVFKILAQGRVERARYAKVKKGYYAQIKERKRLKALGEWIEDLKKQAKIKIYEAANADTSEKKT